MAITTRSERKDRRLDALSKLNTGWGVGETISYPPMQMGLSE